MSVQLTKDNNEEEKRKIELLLDEYVRSGIMLSVSERANDTGTYRIRVRKSPQSEDVNKICQKLNNKGYTAKIVTYEKRPIYIDKRVLVHGLRAKPAHALLPKTIIVAKVNAPNKPQNPGEFSDPRGKKPKKKR